MGVPNQTFLDLSFNVGKCNDNKVSHHLESNLIKNILFNLAPKNALMNVDILSQVRKTSQSSRRAGRKLGRAYKHFFIVFFYTKYIVCMYVHYVFYTVL